ncbi:MAG: virulence factor family protein, partial [Gammaproteobacteria bacterium]|nr:virulence factor family protein [Gammaproteobacteria bacterium]
GFCAAGHSPAASLPAPWVVVAGDGDATCPPAAIRTFIAGIPGAKFVRVPGAGHRVDQPADWQDAVRDSVLKLATRDRELAARPSAVADLPLTEIAGARQSPPALAGTFVLLLTGDGGYAGLDQDVARALAGQGLPVVALSTLRYFWTEREPGLAARDVGRVIRYYAQAWHRPRVVLVGYSFGANVLPFIVPRLSRAERSAVAGVGLVAPATHTGFEIHVADWIPGSVPQGEAILPAVRAMGGVPLLCIYSSEEADALCPDLPAARARRVDLPGGHHFDGDSATLADEILRFAGRK